MPWWGVPHHRWGFCSSIRLLPIGLTFADGSIGAVHYFANGNKAFPKERLDVFAAGRVLQLDNFRRLTGFGWPGFKKMNLWRQDKGQTACAAAFMRTVEQGGPAPIPLEEILEVQQFSFCNRTGSHAPAWEHVQTLQRPPVRGHRRTAGAV